MNKFVLLLIACFPFVNAQFSVHGNVEGAEDQSVFAYYLDGSKEKFWNKVKTDSNGNFNIKMPIRYEGILKLKFENRAYIDLLSDNKNIEFNADVRNGAVNSINIIEGISAKAFFNYSNIQRKKNLLIKDFPYLQSLYQPTDPFFNEIEKEKANILKAESEFDLNNNRIVKYYDETLNFLKETSTTNSEADATIKNTNILEKLNNDGELIETTGFFGSLVLQYLQNSIRWVNNAESVAPALDNAISTLLNKLELETFRGQKALVAILDALPDDQFVEIKEKYLSKMESLSCTKTESVKELMASRAIKVGVTAPNITFTMKHKGAKSLYDVKAKKKLLVFWASWCPACNNEIPFIKEFYTGFKNDGGEIIAISLDYNEFNYANAIKDFNWINDSELLKWDAESVRTYGINATPSLIMLDENNKIIKIGGSLEEILK